MFDKTISLAEAYHSASRNSADLVAAKEAHFINYQTNIIALKAADYTHSNTVDKISLDPPSDLGDVSFGDVLYCRKSSRDFDSKQISFSHLSDLLHYSNGYKDPAKGTKFAPSTGGFKSVELFVIAFSVEGLPAGIYHYDAPQHSLVPLHKGLYQTWVKQHVFYQQEYGQASLVLVMASNMSKLKKKYGLRSYRLGLLDVGHVSQNLYLIATALGLKACASAGFIDHELDDALHLDGQNMSSLLTMIIG